MTKARPELTLAGFVDVELGRAKELAKTFETDAAFDDLTAALEATRPDIVSVAVPYQRQSDIALQIASHSCRPKMLLLEKPLAASLDEAEAIIEACESAGIDVLVNNECAAAVYRQLRDVVRDRFDDDVIAVNAWCSSGMNAIGIHLIGVMRYLFGDVAWACAQAETEYVESLPFSTNFVPEDPRVKAMIVFQNGVTGFLMNSALTRYTYKEIEITCRGGKLRLSDNTNLLQVWATAEPGTSTLSYRLAEPETIAVAHGTVFDAIGEMLCGDRGTGQSVIGGREGLANYRILDGLVRAAQTRQPVTFRSNGDQSAVFG